ncbi:late competence protein ComER [Pullulanibacillus sp. KACC 23026]|uniref:late competence protein ComER n=1 Tax=Pullulanibacillus sp. KACC 23026 TaxID=3028315 RepID=UPI0023B0991F|nr:late competence protein ComER [Pullulanibacillus sp. KACC 23026]WEG14208.1 late competence protein ComER [Pullulanibacillus sp. KACC 23026]
MKIGMIGTGNMGTILTSSLIDGQAAPSSDFIITNRTLTKTQPLKAAYPDITVTECNETLIEQADLIFLCVKPHQIHPLLTELKPLLTRDKLVVSITSPVSVHQLESVINCACARIIPSITNRALAGTTLITFGDRCQHEQRNFLYSLFKKISIPLEINEDITRVASDISSCGPAFISYLLERMIQAAVKVTPITKEQATTLATNMMIGFGQLIKEDFYTLETLREKVQVKGGVTGEGLKVLEAEIGPVFEHMFEKTQEKFIKDHETVDAQFGVGVDGGKDNSNEL